MPIAEVLGLTALNGLLAQLTGLGVIAVAFALLRRFAPLDGVMAVWAGAWTAAFLAILALFVRFFLLPDYSVEALASETPVSNVLDFLYEAGKLLYGWLLLVGSLWLRRRRLPGPVIAAVSLALAVYAAVATGATVDPHGLVRWQIPLKVPMLAATAAVLAGAGPGDRTPGTRPAAFVAAGLAALWLCYAFAFRGDLPEAFPGPQLRILLGFNSYFDLVGHLALAFSLAHVATRGVHHRLMRLHRDLERAHDRLRHAARYDELTGVYNRRAFEELADRSDWEHVEPLAVAMLDMDNLKEINDHRGHASGDAALAFLATRLTLATGEEGVVFRWGGDEFLCVCTPCTRDDLQRRLDAVLAEPGAVPGLSSMPLQVSLGTAQRDTGERLSDVIARADQAMYRHKFRKRAYGVEQRSLWEDAAGL
jgi:diguanylate cyclase (GGDEF)-like protein